MYSIGIYNTTKIENRETSINQCLCLKIHFGIKFNTDL